MSSRSGHLEGTKERVATDRQNNETGRSHKEHWQTRRSEETLIENVIVDASAAILANSLL